MDEAELLEALQQADDKQKKSLGNTADKLFPYIEALRNDSELADGCIYSFIKDVGEQEESMNDSSLLTSSVKTTYYQHLT